nr:immunoglobulin heavy chain junction region [Macaca mulatta]MOX64836.1 immunoglobulin heavy chain junction region [Macaca mulatta]MOX65503.1 immunoglobulin heavy chain junction region [Macaca mulatta]MOX68044.1 immunoglobulin heavy chain junction region [Macaca mulatta]
CARVVAAGVDSW